ncbi:MBL fold metallo-hydrolase [Octadecabacter sp. 1_MG-2023]|uniref:MBL fold metallo-hydrolase n=1 Tax=unclassified Octadecabacter TaxID=196158 RepID=UPI001C07F55C|nr:MULTISPECIES: MBL fold metallo-hydrolase [unclassified Octadecabacter]MBU2992082.1 MBL fold metallo-hydrolase [Octadecabacter sp. B2R22]MDO6735161.1 MBL fold metallo-hydrolase [Octadecabacter sp. 1_MG-2023]
MTSSITLMGVKGGPAIRPGSNMPTSNLLHMGGQTILVDAGLGCTRGICDAGVALTGIDCIVITHLHSDHYLELGPFFHTAWTAGLNRPIRVIGPEGLQAYWDGFLSSMAFDIELRQDDEGRCPLAPLAEIEVLTEGPAAIGGVSLHAMRNIHPPIHDTYALRFDHADKRIVVSGDTAFMPEMIDFANGADILVHEAMLIDGVEALVARMTNGDDRLRTHILRSHTSAEDVGRIARDAGVKQLALTHMVPDGDPDFTEAHWVEEIRKHFNGRFQIGIDGITLTA